MLKKKVVLPRKKKNLISKKETLDNKVNQLHPKSKDIVIHPGERITIVSESLTKTPDFNDDF